MAAANRDSSVNRITPIAKVHMRTLDAHLQYLTDIDSMSTEIEDIMISLMRVIQRTFPSLRNTSSISDKAASNSPSNDGAPSVTSDDAVKNSTSGNTNNPAPSDMRNMTSMSDKATSNLPSNYEAPSVTSDDAVKDSTSGNTNNPAPWDMRNITSMSDNAASNLPSNNRAPSFTSDVSASNDDAVTNSTSGNTAASFASKNPTLLSGFGFNNNPAPSDTSPFGLPFGSNNKPAPSGTSPFGLAFGSNNNPASSPASNNPVPDLSNLSDLKTPLKAPVKAEYDGRDHGLTVQLGDNVIVYHWDIFTKQAVAHNPRNDSFGLISAYLLKLEDQQKMKSLYTIKFNSSYRPGLLEWRASDTITVCKWNNDAKTDGIGYNKATNVIGRFSVNSNAYKFIDPQRTGFFGS